MEKNLGISMPLANESIVSYQQPQLAIINNKGEGTVDSATIIKEDKEQCWWRCSKKESNLLKCRVKDSVQRKEYLTAFYQNKISDVELERAISNTIRNAYEEASSGGWLDKDNQTEFLNKMYCDLTTQTVQAAVYSNIYEGKALNQKNTMEDMEGGSFVYYNAKFYYSCEKVKEIIRNCFDNFAGELGIADLDKERYLAEHMKNGDDFNAVWSASYKNCKMLNTEATPPENFSFFYQESYVNRQDGFKEYDYEEHRYLMVNGISSVSKEKLKLLDGVMNRKTFANLFDYAKSKFSDQGGLWEHLHYLKNFRVYFFPDENRSNFLARK